MWFVTLLQYLVVFSPLQAEKVTLDADVLILGAGMAGISAANTLNENHITDFIIIEAEGRIGGRMKSVVLPSTNVRVELGANWIQGIDPVNPQRHPLWKIAEMCGGLGGHFVKDFNNGSMHVFDENGRNISGSAAFRERLSYWNKLLDPGLPKYSVERQKAGLPDVTVREGLRVLGWDPSSPLDNLIEWYGFDLDEQAAPPEKISVYANYPDDTYDNFGNPNRTENYFVTDQHEGFEKVARCLAQQFLSKNDKRLVLDTVVEEINWSNSKEYVCVKVKQSSVMKEYCASHVIVTFSLGVLQSNAVAFVPPLPEAKVNAIHACLCVLYLKIFLEFDTIFWKNDTNVDNILRIDAIRGHFVQFQPIDESLPILFTTVTDEMAKLVYQQSVNETTSQIMKALRLMYGESIPDPLHVTIPDWWTNPLFHGMYTANPIGCNGDATHTLAQPLGNLHFGGSATNEYSGFVHGAYFSGIDTANEIITSS